MTTPIRAVMVSGSPDAVKRRCYDCTHCVALVSWWCENDEAIDRRGTAIPGAVNCQDWAPVPVEKPSWRDIFRSLFGRRVVEIHGDA